MAWTAHRGRVQLQQVAPELQDAAVELPADLHPVEGVEVAPRAQQLQLHARLAGNRHEAGTGGDQRPQ